MSLSTTRSAALIPSLALASLVFASHPQAKNAYIDPTSLPAYQAVAEYLLSRAD